MCNASEAEKRASLYFTQDTARVGLAEFAGGYKGHSVNALSNIAQALMQMGQYELALGYAVAATRLDAFCAASDKPLYRAALCCSLLRQPLAALHFICQVRACAEAAKEADVMVLSMDYLASWPWHGVVVIPDSNALDSLARGQVRFDTDSRRCTWKPGTGCRLTLSQTRLFVSDTHAHIRPRSGYSGIFER